MKAIVISALRSELPAWVEGHRSGKYRPDDEKTKTFRNQLIPYCPSYRDHQFKISGDFEKFSEKDMVELVRTDKETQEVFLQKCQDVEFIQEVGEKNIFCEVEDYSPVVFCLLRRIMGAEITRATKGDEDAIHVAYKKRSSLGEVIVNIDDVEERRRFLDAMGWKRDWQISRAEWDVDYDEEIHGEQPDEEILFPNEDEEKASDQKISEEEEEDEEEEE